MSHDVNETVHSMLSNGSTLTEILAFAAKCAANKVDAIDTTVGLATVAPKGAK